MVELWQLIITTSHQRLCVWNLRQLVQWVLNGNQKGNLILVSFRGGGGGGPSSVDSPYKWSVMQKPFRSMRFLYHLWNCYKPPRWSDVYVWVYRAKVWCPVVLYLNDLNTWLYELWQKGIMILYLVTLCIFQQWFSGSQQYDIYLAGTELLAIKPAGVYNRPEWKQNRWNQWVYHSVETHNMAGSGLGMVI